MSDVQAEVAGVQDIPDGDESSEVRPDEFGRGIDRPLRESAFAPEVVEALRAPLDPDRVRRRQGRGRGQFEYLAGHDVKRRANELFGFGNWGHRIVDQAEIATVDVENDQGRAGVHVGYRCVVEVWIRREDGTHMTTEGSGYGDGVEYGPAARVTACELALKESETDALKRAFTDLGDQFGLILYAKADEKQRIDRDRNAGEAAPIVNRQEKAGRDPGAPRTFAEILQRLRMILGGGEPDEEAAKAWLEEAATVKYGGPVRDLDRGERDRAGQTLGRAVMILEEQHPDLAFATDVRKTVNAAFAEALDGVILDGPPWSLDPTDAAAGYPTHSTWLADQPAPEGDESEVAAGAAAE